MKSCWPKKKFFKLSALLLRFITRWVMACLRSHTRMPWPSSLGCETFLFGNNLSSMSSTRDTRWGLFIPDLIAFDAVVVDTKVIDRITDHERGLMLNYLRIKNLRDGRHPQFQASQIGMGANCFMSSRPLMFQEGFVTSCSFVSIRG